MFLRNVSFYNLKRSRIPKDHNLDTQWKPEELPQFEPAVSAVLEAASEWFCVPTKERSEENRRWIEPVTLEGPDKSTLKCILSKKRKLHTVGLFVPSTVWGLTFTPTINCICVWFCWFGSSSLPAPYVLRTTHSPTNTTQAALLAMPTVSCLPPDPFPSLWEPLHGHVGFVSQF